MALVCRLESADLPEETRSDLEKWVARTTVQNGSGAIRKKGRESGAPLSAPLGAHRMPVPAGGAPGVDLFRYELEIDRDGRPLRYTFDDATLPEPLVPVIDYLCDYLEPADDQD